jgi:outer membrane lipopolysaccharide assembly protein LptE/RlpB
MRALLFCLVGLFTLSGCANYNLGSGGKLTFQTVYIAPVVNESNLPQSVAVFSTGLREAFLRDGRVSLVNTVDQADVVLTVKLLKYSRASTASQSTDTGLARKFDVTLEAEASLRDNRQNKFLFEKRKVEAVRQVFTNSGQLQSEYQNVPLLSETLSKNVLSATLDVW